MKHQNRYFGTKPEFTAFIKKAVPDLLAGRMDVDGANVAIPNDANLDYKVKYEFDDLGGSFSLKVSWGSGGKSKDDEAAGTEIG
ncbi:MAG: transcription initiation factor IIE [Clostridia bacterium]|nr:transcription initiation factor IIE [Clostridia bacterium]